MHLHRNGPVSVHGGGCSYSSPMPLLGPAVMLLSFDLVPQATAEHDPWHTHEHLPERPRLGGAHLLEGVATPAMTTEQRIRGADAGIDGALATSGYELAALADPAPLSLAPPQLEAHGACDVEHAPYRIDYTLSAHEVDARGECRC